jgi:SAM-dependent methyltransferase
MAGDEDWREVNRANWDERTGIHLGPGSGYDLGPLRAGRGALDAIVRAELGPVAGLRVLHLQCHFGKDTLTLAQGGAAAVVGLDFSAPAIAAARRLAGELGLADRARFVEADLYDAPRAIPEPGGFDLVFVTWGALCWLPGWSSMTRPRPRTANGGGAGSRRISSARRWCWTTRSTTPTPPRA